MAQASEKVFGQETTAAEVVEGLNFDGKIVLITGTSAGIGVETARAFLSIGATVIGCVRNLEKMAPIADELKTSTSNDKFEAIQCDLASFESIRACAAAFREKYNKIDVLICNAGVMATNGRRETADGMEFQIGVNHLGHFLLVGLLVDLMLAADNGARMVALSSVAHKRQGIMFEDMQYTAEPYDKWKAYGQAKTANILFAREFNRRYSGRGVLGFSAHPGGIQTELGRELTDEDRARFASMGSAIFWKTTQQGAATSVRAATDPSFGAEQGGSYFHDCNIVTEVLSSAEPAAFYAPNIGSHAASADNDERLWVESEKLVGFTYPE